ncbi:MAG: hypothetical protein ACO1NY_13270 [Pseudorhodoplanes sp.]
MDNEISVELGRVRWHLAALRFEHAMLRHAVALRRLKYDPNQPRVPAGNADGGQWTRDSGTGPLTSVSNRVDASIFRDPAESLPPGFVLSDATFDPLIEGAQYVQAQIAIDSSNALTGISAVDSATKGLSRVLERTMVAVDFIPTWTPQVYGTAVHVAFGVQVRLQGLPGIGPDDVEQSFFGGDEVRYGRLGSIRTDVVLRNQAGEIIAIYDVKTGGALLTAARVRELRAKTGVGPSVPIIELHVVRGATVKGYGRRGGILRIVFARLWDRFRPDNSDPVGGL